MDIKRYYLQDASGGFLFDGNRYCKFVEAPKDTDPLTGWHEAIDVAPIIAERYRLLELLREMRSGNDGILVEVWYDKIDAALAEGGE